LDPWFPHTTLFYANFPQYLFNHYIPSTAGNLSYRSQRHPPPRELKSSNDIPIMETVTNMATQAAKLVWGGDSEEKEPISGAQGNVSRGEPFDAGNMDPSQQQTMSKTTGSNRDASTQSTTGTPSLRQDVDSNRQIDPLSKPSSVAAAGTETPKVADERSLKADGEVTNNRAPDIGASKSQAADDNRAPDIGASKSQAADDSRVADSSVPDSSVSDSRAADGRASDTRPSKNVSRKGSGTTSKATEESHFGKPDGDDGETGDPNTGIMGDGPKPLDVVAEENGGDAGNNVDAKHKSDTDEDDGTPSRGQQSKGTGEMHVMTSGFAADGGDFDATKPGAGREADRLMEEKKGHTGAGADGTGSKESGNAHDKPSLGDRLKNKLHKH
ncbi:hypothetical protein CP532_1620, partial [Ophiocordyceps camponoti-leonardi (nom. inval.)]